MEDPHAIAVAPGAAPAAPGPLTADQQSELADAGRRARKATGAAKVAAFNGWCTAVFAGLCAPFAAFSLTALVLGLGLGVIAYNEFRGRRLIRAFDLRGPRLLGWNQVGLMALVVLYSVAQLHAGLTGPNPYAAQLSAEPQLAEMLGPIEDLQRLLVLAVYGTVVALTILFQGANAVYYFTRAKHIRNYLAQTPGWVVELQRHVTASAA